MADQLLTKTQKHFSSWDQTRHTPRDANNNSKAVCSELWPVITL